MAAEPHEIITHEEFEKRLEANNVRLLRELEAAQIRVAQLEALIARKETFSRRLTEVLTEIEHEEDEIAAMERGLRLSRSTPLRRSPANKPTR